MIDDKVRAAAERSMGRLAPDSDKHPANKKRRVEDGGSKDGGSTKAAEDEPSSVQYEYQAADILSKGSPGFLITCTFKREKSAIKEVIPILTKYLGRALDETQTTAAAASASTAGNGSDETAATGGAAEATKPSPTPEVGLSLVKLGGRGVMFIRLKPADGQGLEGLAGLASRTSRLLMLDVSSGAHPKLQYCHRVVPVERTCVLSIENLESTAKYTTDLYLKENIKATSEGEKPKITYAVRFQSSGGVKEAGAELPDRAVVIKTVAEAVLASCKEVTEASVNLGSPDVAAIGEAVTLASGEVICMLCVVGKELFTPKPKLRLHSVAGK